MKDPGFKDVPKTHPNYKYIAAIANAGYMNGSKGVFNPNNNVTRGQLSKVLSLAYELEAKNYIYMPFKDAQNSSFNPYIKSLLMYDITTGVSSEKFGVNDTVKRGQLAVFIHRVEQYKALPKFDETITGSTVSLDRVQFEVGQLRAIGENIYNEGIVEITLNEGGDNLTFKPKKEGTAYVNVTGYTPDVDGTLAYVGYQLDVKDVAGELQVTMTALKEPLPLFVAVESGPYTAVKVFDWDGKELDVPTAIVPFFELENDVHVAVKDGIYKIQLTASTGEVVEKLAVVEQDPDFGNGQTVEYFDKDAIVIELNSNVKDLYIEHYSDTMTYEVVGNKLIINNPTKTQMNITFNNGEVDQYVTGFLYEIGNGVVISDYVLDILKSGKSY